MNEERLKILVDYFKALSSLKGLYHKEIKRAINLIEREFEIESENK